jgi:heme/copper-type cytochrome/quinol oxidase subunit 2
MLVFLVAGSILLAAQTLLVVREVVRSRDGDVEHASGPLEAAWVTLPGILVLALLAYSLGRLLGS